MSKKQTVQINVTNRLLLRQLLAASRELADVGQKAVNEIARHPELEKSHPDLWQLSIMWDRARGDWDDALESMRTDT